MVAGSDLVPSTEGTIAFAKRPGYGRTGRPLEVFVNLFKTLAKTYKIATYDVAVHKENGPLDFGEGDRMFWRIWDRVHLFEGAMHFASRIVAYDGNKLLFVAGEPLERSIFEVPADMGRKGRYRMRFKLAAQADQKIAPETMMQVLNLLVQSDVKSRFTISTKRIAFPEHGPLFQPTNVEGLHLRRGFTFNIRNSSAGLLLNLDTHAGILYPPDFLHDFAASYLRVNNIRQLADLEKEHRDPWNTLAGALVRKKVYQIQPKERLRTIRGIVPHAGSVSFELDGTPTTIEEYFFQRYNIKLQYPRFPGIVTPQKEIIPFELCKLVPGQAYTRRPSANMMRGLLELAKDGPAQRLAKITDGLRVLGILDSPVVQQAQIQIRGEPERILGRILPAPSLKFKDRDEKPDQGVWNMLRKKLFQGSVLAIWAVINAARVPDREVQNFTNKLIGAMQEVGMNVSNQPSLIREDNPNQIGPALRNYATRNQKAQLIVAIIPFDAAAIRKTVKQFGDILFGIATQCIRVDKSKGLRTNDQYLKNNILKINTKLGGLNMVPKSLGEKQSNGRNYNDGTWMFLGCDVSHPSPGVQRPSIASLVGSWDKECSKYSAQLSVQDPRQEMVEKLGDMLDVLLTLFYNYRKGISEIHRLNVPRLPRHLVLFRDGVSDKELVHVLQTEWRVLKKKLEEVYKKYGALYDPQLTLVVVGKRHRIRFFPRNGEGADRSGNVSAGFVVDKDIVSESLFDYYLQSHAGLKGTSRSSHYICIQDENNFSADELQQLSYDLCHVYQRATRSVSIPAPVYYADIACARADFHFPPDVNFLDETSVAGSGQGQTAFDITPWLNNFRGIHGHQSMKMYFM